MYRELNEVRSEFYIWLHAFVPTREINIQRLLAVICEYYALSPEEKDVTSTKPVVKKIGRMEGTLHFNGNNKLNQAMMEYIASAWAIHDV